MYLDELLWHGISIAFASSVHKLFQVCAQILKHLNIKSTTVARDS